MLNLTQNLKLIQKLSPQQIFGASRISTAQKTAAAPTSLMDTAAAHFISPVVNLVVSWS